jgi:hypothetical protein
MKRLVLLGTLLRRLIGRLWLLKRLLHLLRTPVLFPMERQWLRLRLLRLLVTIPRLLMRTLWLPATYLRPLVVVRIRHLLMVRMRRLLVQHLRRIQEMQVPRKTNNVRAILNLALRYSEPDPLRSGETIQIHRFSLSLPMWVLSRE